LDARLFFEKLQIAIRSSELGHSEDPAGTDCIVKRVWGFCNVGQIRTGREFTGLQHAAGIVGVLKEVTHLDVTCHPPLRCLLERFDELFDVSATVEQSHRRTTSFRRFGTL
jgi:hypothetical protein